MSTVKLSLAGKPSRKGIIFNPQNKDTLTYGEVMDSLIEIVDEDELKEYYHKYIEYIAQKENLDMNKATAMAAHNIGYSLGYFSRETRMRVERVLEIAHPFFGKAKENDLSPDEILKMGMEMGERVKKTGSI